MAILVFGSLNIDRTFHIPHFLKEGETLHSSRMSILAGGKGANQAVALAKAGADVKLAGTIGDDGKWLLPVLEEYGVDTSLIRVKEDRQTGTADILVDSEGRNGIVLSCGCNFENDKDYIDSVFGKFHEGDWVVFQNEVNDLGYLFSKAIEKEMKICFNPSPMEESLRKLPLQKTSLLVVNELEGAALTLTDESFDGILEALVSAFPESGILLTLGSHGSMYGYKDYRYRCPAVDSPVIDTTAAGDAYLGYYLAMSLAGKSVDEAMQIASQAASLAISRHGAMDSIPFCSELD